jgi:hypothetical protein
VSNRRRRIENALKKLKSDSAIARINGRLDLRDALVGGLKCSWYKILTFATCPIASLEADGLCSVGDGADLISDAHSGGSDVMRRNIEWAVGEALGRGVMPDLPVAEPTCPTRCPNQKDSRVSGSCRIHAIGFAMFECRYSIRKTCDETPSPPGLLDRRFNPRAGAMSANIDIFDLPESCPGFGTIVHCVCGIGAEADFNDDVQRSHQATATQRLRDLRAGRGRAARQAAGKLCPNNCEPVFFEPRPKPLPYNSALAQDTLGRPGWCFCSEMAVLCFPNANWSVRSAGRGSTSDWIDDLGSRFPDRRRPRGNWGNREWAPVPVRSSEVDETLLTHARRPTESSTEANAGAVTEPPVEPWRASQVSNTHQARGGTIPWPTQHIQRPDFNRRDFRSTGRSTLMPHSRSTENPNRPVGRPSPITSRVGHASPPPE